MSAPLVIIDVQKAVDDPRYGRRGQEDAEANMARLIAHWRELGNPVVHVRDNSLDPNSPYAPGKPTHAFKSEVAPLDHEIIVDKQTSNAFIGTDLMNILEETGSSEVVMCGVHLHKCVDATVRMAASVGFMVFLPADCVVATDVTDFEGRQWSAEDVHALTLAVLDGSYAKVLNSTDLISASDNATLQ